MKRVLKWLGWIAAGLLGIVILAILGVYLISSLRIQKTYQIPTENVPIPTGEKAIAEGQRQFFTHGCIDCHDTNGAGKMVIDDPIIGHVTGANLTPGEGGSGRTFTDADWVRAIRHGVGSDQKPLIVMPSLEYNKMNNEDLGYLIAYLKTLPPVDRVIPPQSLGPLGRILLITKAVAILPAEQIDHAAVRPEAVSKGPTVEYGHYLASQTCIGCHGETLSGGPVPGLPPETPFPRNLTPDQETGLGTWSEADFARLLREGQRPDGTSVDPAKMPYPAFQYYTDEEITALWLYLQSLPAKPYGNR